MSGIERDKVRIKATGEIFTPSAQVKRIIDGLPDEIWGNPDEKWIDPVGCGDGQLLGEVLIKKVENGIDFEKALSTLYGVDLMQDNIELCRERLLCGQKHLRHIVEKNIVCADCEQYHYRFDGTDPYKSQDDLHKESLFEIE